jgi:hypothetical protein
MSEMESQKHKEFNLSFRFPKASGAEVNETRYLIFQHLVAFQFV